MFKISIEESLKNFDKNRFITFLSVLMFALLFVLEGYTMSYHTLNELRKERSKHESLQNWGLYTLSSQKSSRQVYLADPTLFENIDIPTLEFWEKVEDIENLEYLTLHHGETFTAVYDKILDHPNLYDEAYYAEHNKLGINSLFVSPNFHHVEYYRVIEGRDFTDEDMVYVEGQPRAVLLGCKFRGIFEIGDIIELTTYRHSFLGNHSEIPSLKVIGFIEEDSTVLGSSGFTVYDLDSYMVVPMIDLSKEDYLNASETVQAITRNANETFTLSYTKFLIPVGYESEVLSQLQDAFYEYSRVSKYYSIVDKKAYIERLQERTETVTEFSLSITAVLAIFSFATMAISIMNKISRNIKDYAVHITIGATKGTAVLFIAVEILLSLVFSFIISLILLKPLMEYQGLPFITPASWGVWGITVVLIIFISALTAIISLRKYDICTLIK